MAGSDRCDFDKMTQGLGTEYLIMETEFKLHPSVASLNPVHVGVKTLVEENDIRPDDVEGVIVRGCNARRFDDYNPVGPVDGMFSLPYCVATTILREKLLPDMYSEEKLKDPRVQALLKRIKVESDPEAERLWYEKQWKVFSIEISLKDRKRIHTRVEWPKERPPFGKSEVEKKFRDLASLILSADRVEEIVQTVGELESLSDISELAALLY